MAVFGNYSTQPTPPSGDVSTKGVNAAFLNLYALRGDVVQTWSTAFKNQAQANLGLLARTTRADLDYTATAGDRLIAYSTLTAARTVTLPAASAYPAGATLTVVDESGSCSATNTITITRAGSDTINGATSAVLSYGRAFLALESNGSSVWTIVDQSSLGMAQQAPGAVAITGGAINGTTIGATTASTGAFTTLSASGAATFSAGATSNQFTVSGTSGQFAALDRSTSGFGVFYRTGGINRLWDSTYGDVITYNSSGQVTLPTLTLGTNPTATDSSQLVPSTSWIGASFDRVAIAATASATAIAANKLVTLSSGASTPTAAVADNTTASLGGKADGFVNAAVAASAACTVLRTGQIGGFSGLTPGATYYLGTAGGITTAAPTASGTTIQVVGIALTAAILDFRPGEPEYNE